MDTIRICRQCRKPLAQNAPEGLCLECLARVALGSEPAAKPDTTLTISPEALVRVRYFGDYELLEEIARGGMGIVWKARQTSLNRTVAVKMILTGELASEAEVQRFRREAEAAANLQHPNIVAIHEVGEHDGQHFYSMDYIEGRDLGTLVRESGPMAPTQASECLKTIAEAVHFAHQRGTLHRDLKPQNVLVDSAGVPHVTDFGLAKLLQRNDSLTESGTAMGSPNYMPPEQAAGQLDRIGPQSDVYALGAILYETLTGQPPFWAETPVATMQQVLESDPVSPRKLNPGLPPDLETICLKCLEKNPERRYHSARALAEELTRFLNHEPIQARPPSAVRKTENWLRKNPWTLMAAVSVVAMVLSGLLYWQYERVQFLKNHPAMIDRRVIARALAGLRLEGWKISASMANAIIVFTYLIYLNSSRLRMDLRQLFGWPRETKASHAESQAMRIVCGLIAVSVIAFGLLYFARLIRFWVWETAPPAVTWFGVYANCYFGLMLLYLLVKDYQKFIHGAPSRVLSADQKESLLKAICGGDHSDAIKLIREIFPDASLDEARAIVEKFAQDAAIEPEAKNSGKLLLRQTQYLNWRMMSVCVLVEVPVVAGLWLTIPPLSTATRVEIFGAWFLSGAMTMLLLRLKSSRMRFLGLMLCFLLPSVLLPRFYQDGLFFILGFLSGVSLMLCGFTPKRRKSVPTKGPPDIGPSR